MSFETDSKFSGKYVLATVAQSACCLIFCSGSFDNWRIYSF